MTETNSVELAARLNSLVEEVKETKSNLCKELSIEHCGFKNIRYSTLHRKQKAKWCRGL